MPSITRLMSAAGIELAIVISLFPSSASKADQYRVIPLKHPNSDIGGQPVSFADSGMIVGHVFNNNSGALGHSTPGYWDFNGDFTPIELGGQLGGIFTSANGGVFVGNYGSSLVTPLPTSGIPSGRAFAILNDTSTLLDISLTPNRDAEIVGINQDGVVAGSGEVPFIIDGISYPVPRAYIWSGEDGFNDLGDIGGRFTRATAINEPGNVIGYAEDQNEFQRAFFWSEEDGMIEIIPRSWGESRAHDINNINEVLLSLSSSIFSPPVRTNNPILWRASDDYIEIVPPSGTGGRAFAINDLSQVIGQYLNENGQNTPYLWDPQTGAVDIQSLLSENSPWQIIGIGDIDNQGRLIGLAAIDGSIKSVLLTPVPEPDGCVIFMCLLIITFSLNRQRTQINGLSTYEFTPKSKTLFCKP